MGQKFTIDPPVLPIGPRSSRHPHDVFPRASDENTQVPQQKKPIQVKKQAKIQ